MMTLTMLKESHGLCETSAPDLSLGVATQILEIVFRRRNLLSESGADAMLAGLRCRGHHLQKILSQMRRNRPIHLVLPAFPAKSPNPEKTLGTLPDYGEVVALEELEKLCREIEGVYPAGARVTLCSDGRVFSDLVLVADETVGDYAEGIRAILEDRGLTHLDTYRLEDLFPGLSFDEMRAALVRRYGESLETLRQRVLSDATERQLFNGLHRFLFEDRAALFKDQSRSQVREQSKTVAYQVIQRSHAWSSLVEEQFPGALRLSIHPQPESSTKIGIRLVPGLDQWGTPWHGVIVSDGKSCWLAKRREAEARGARLVLEGGKYPYFLVDSSLPGEIQ